MFNDFVYQSLKPYRYSIIMLYLLASTWGIQSICLSRQLKLTVDALNTNQSITSYLISCQLIYTFGYLAIMLRETIYQQLLPNLNAHVYKIMLSQISDIKRAHNPAHLTYSLNELKQSIVDTILQIEPILGQIITLVTCVTTLITIYRHAAYILPIWIICFIIRHYFHLKQQTDQCQHHTQQHHQLISSLSHDKIETINDRIYALKEIEVNYGKQLRYMKLHQSIICLLSISFILGHMNHLYSKQIISLGQITSIIHLSMLSMQTWTYLVNQLPQLIKTFGRYKLCIQTLNQASTSKYHIK